jgi:hypothetical protein
VNWVDSDDVVGISGYNASKCGTDRVDCYIARGGSNECSRFGVRFDRDGDGDVRHGAIEFNTSGGRYVMRIDVDKSGCSWGGVRRHGTDGVGVNKYGSGARCADRVDGDWVGRGGLRGYGTGWDGVGVSWRGANGVGGGNGGGIDGDGVGGHRVHERGANGVYGDVAGGWVDWSGGGIGWFGLQGVVGDGAEAVRLVDLCCPVEPHGFVRLRVGSYAGCGRWGGVLYLAPGRSCLPSFSCVHLPSRWLAFPRSLLLLYSPSPFLSLHCSYPVVLLLGRRYGVVWVRGSGSGSRGCGLLDLRLGWDWCWGSVDVGRVCYAIRSFRGCCGFVDG